MHVRQFSNLNSSWFFGELSLFAFGISIRVSGRAHSIPLTLDDTHFEFIIQPKSYPNEWGEIDDGEIEFHTRALSAHPFRSHASCTYIHLCVSPSFEITHWIQISEFGFALDPSVTHFGWMYLYVCMESNQFPIFNFRLSPLSRNIVMRSLVSSPITRNIVLYIPIEIDSSPSECEDKSSM